MDEIDEPLRTCFAFNEAGQKCEHPAGHFGDHAITTSWTDEECWQPGRTVTIKAFEEKIREEPTWSPTEEMGPLPTMPQSRPGSCIICSHRMHPAQCPVGECDCRAGLEG